VAAMMRAVAAEFMKLKRSRMPLWSGLVVLVAAGLGLAVMPVLSDPATQAKVAAGGGAFAKAVATGLYHPTWANYLHIGTQGMSGSWGVLTFGLVTAYLFGRESRERTSSAMLTLPLRREYVVLAKMVVLAVWVFGLAILSVLLTMGVVAVLGVEGFSWSAVFKNVTDTLAVAALLYLTLPFVAWFAALGKGYLRPMLFSLAMVMVGNTLVATSLSRWFPWNMPLHLVGASWYPVPPSSLVPGSWAVAVGVFLAGLTVLLWQTDHADSAR
jgi:ABC-2 type transport system permease protein